MKVVHVVPAISKEASGPSYSVRRLCDSIVEAGADVTLAALDWEPINEHRDYVRAFPIGWGPRRLGRSPALARWLDHEVISGRASVLHNHGMWQMNAIYPAWAVRKGGAVLMVSPRGALSEYAMNHGSILKRVFWPLLQRPALDAAACFHATAESEYRDIQRLGFRQPVAIIPNGIDLPPCQFRDHESRPVRTLLFLSRVHKIKGLELLLEAWSRVQGNYPEWRLVIAGSDAGYNGPSGYLSFLKGSVKRGGLQRVNFAGELSGSEKWNAFAEADLFILPTYSENFGVVVAEALASGTPVIVTKGAPWGDVVNKRAGWWVEVSADALVAALGDALSRNPNELREMGERGRRWMDEEFSWKMIGHRMLDTYEWLCGQRGKPPPWVHLD